MSENVNTELLLKLVLSKEEYVIYLEHRWEYDLFVKVLQDNIWYEQYKMCDYKGKYCYSPFSGTYSESSSKTNPGAYTPAEIVTILDIFIPNKCKITL